MRQGRVDNGQTLLMWRDRERTPEGYKPMVVKDEFFSTDMAVLAVLVIMEADRAKPKEINQYEGSEPELDFAKALLKYYRGEEFEALEPKKQKDMAVRTYTRMYDVLEALRNLMAFLEYGEPSKNLTTKPLETFHRDVRAAELKHIDKPMRKKLGKPRLTDYAIAKILHEEGLLSVEPPASPDDEYYMEKYKKNHERIVRDSAKRGKNYLVQVLGEDDFEQYV